MRPDGQHETGDRAGIAPRPWALRHLGSTPYRHVTRRRRARHWRSRPLSVLYRIWRRGACGARLVHPKDLLVRKGGKR